MDYTLHQDELKLTKGSKWPENDYEVIVDNAYANTIKLNKEIKTKVNGHKLKVVGYYTSDSVKDKYFVNNNMIKYRLILDNARKVVALELFTAAQALWLRGEDQLAPATAAVYRLLREEIPPVEYDVIMYPFMNAAEAMLRDGRILRAAENVCGALE